MTETAGGLDEAGQADFAALLRTGESLVEAGLFTEALAELQRARRLLPKDERTLGFIGVAAYKLNDFKTASEAYEALCLIAPDEVGHAINLGLVHLKANDLPSALRALEAATRIAPGNVNAHRYLGYALAQAGALGRAHEHLLAAGEHEKAAQVAEAIAARQSAPPTALRSLGSGVRAPPRIQPLAVGDGGRRANLTRPPLTPAPPPAVLLRPGRTSSEPRATTPGDQHVGRETTLSGDWGERLGQEPLTDDLSVAEQFASEADAPPPVSGPSSYGPIVAGSIAEGLARSAEVTAPTDEPQTGFQDEPQPDLQAEPQAGFQAEPQGEPQGEPQPEPEPEPGPEAVWTAADDAATAVPPSDSFAEAAALPPALAEEPVFEEFAAAPQPIASAVGEDSWAEGSFAEPSEHGAVASADDAASWPSTHEEPMAGEPLVDVAMVEEPPGEAPPTEEPAIDVVMTEEAVDEAPPVEEPTAESGFAEQVFTEAELGSERDGGDGAGGGGAADEEDSDDVLVPAGSELEWSGPEAGVAAAAPTPEEGEAGFELTDGGAEVPIEVAAGERATSGPGEEAQLPVDAVTSTLGDGGEPPPLQGPGVYAQRGDPRHVDVYHFPSGRAARASEAWHVVSLASEEAERQAPAALDAEARVEVPAPGRDAGDGAAASSAMRVTVGAPVVATEASRGDATPAEPSGGTARAGELAPDVAAPSEGAGPSRDEPAAERTVAASVQGPSDVTGSLVARLDDTPAGVPVLPLPAMARGAFQERADFRVLRPTPLEALPAHRVDVAGLQGSTGAFRVGGGNLLLSVRGELITRVTGLMAAIGSVELVRERRRSRGRATEVPFGEGQRSMYRARGEGHLLLERGPRERSLTALALRDEGLYLVESALFAFEEPVAFENGRLAAEAAGAGPGPEATSEAHAARDGASATGSLELDAVLLHGVGAVLVEHAAPLVVIPVVAGMRTVWTRAQLVAWSGHLSARLVYLAGLPALELSGEGWALGLAHAPEVHP